MVTGLTGFEIGFITGSDTEFAIISLSSVLEIDLIEKEITNVSDKRNMRGVELVERRQLASDVIDSLLKQVSVSIVSILRKK